MPIKSPAQLKRRLDAKPPEPPKDFLPRFRESTHFIFGQYLKSRPYSEWNASDLRVLAQICILEDIIMDATDAIATDGITVIGSKGQPVSNPVMASMIKAQQQQGSMMRRLGIAIGGIANPKGAKKDADWQRKQDEIDANDNHGLLA